MCMCRGMRVYVHVCVCRGMRVYDHRIHLELLLHRVEHLLEVTMGLGHTHCVTAQTTSHAMYAWTHVQADVWPRPGLVEIFRSHLDPTEFC